MKLDKKIIKALYESQVGCQDDVDSSKKLNQAEQKSFFCIICEYGMYSSNWAYLDRYNKNDKFPFSFSDADNLEDDTNFEITEDGELKLAYEKDFDGEPITWENLLDSDKTFRSSSKYEWSMIGLQTFKTRKEAEDLIKNNEQQMEKCARYDLLDSDDRWGDATFNFEVREYTKDDFERDLENL